MSDEKKRIGRYEIIKELGRGNMGAVYLARDPFIDRQVAVKLAAHQDSGTEDNPDNFNRQFFNEARSAGRLQHPNIVAIYDASVYRGSCYMAMEYVDGPDLREFCRKDSLLEPEQLLQILYNLCKALEYAHNMEIVHRDIKPANIMLTGEGVVKIGDFGIACVTEDTIDTARVGTPHYMSPEQIKEEPVDGRSDIFSLGCVMYEMLTGEKAYPGDNPAAIINKIVNQEPPALRGVRPDLPAELDEAVARSLAGRTDKRYQTCADLAYDLKRIARTFKNAHHDDSNDVVVDYVCSIPFFSDFSRDEVTEIMSACSIVRCKKDEFIVREGETDDTMYVILSGSVGVIKRGQKFINIEKGECFGEMAYLSHRPREAGIQAQTDCAVLSISSTLMNRLPDGVQLKFLKGFARILAGRLAKDNQIISYLSKQTGRGR